MPGRPPHRHIQIPSETCQTNPIHYQTSQKICKILLEWRLWNFFPKPQNHPYIPSNPPQTIRTPPTTGIYHRNRLYGQCRLGPRICWDPTFSVLRQPNLARPWNQIPNGRKTSSFLGKCSKTAPPILPKPPYHYQHLLPYPENPPKTRPCRMNVILHRGTFQIQHPLRTTRLYQSQVPTWLC